MFKYFFPDMSKRSFELELMDLPDVDLKKLIRTIRQFRLLNSLFSCSIPLIKKHFFSIMEQNPKKAYTMLDIGAGGCDITVKTAQEARKRKLNLTITALDRDERILPTAMEAIKNFPEIKLVHASAKDLNELGSYDFIFSNHFLHHLDWEEIEAVVRLVQKNTRISFLLNDLARSNWAYLGYTIFTGILIHKSLAFYDGRLSIQRGFLEKELVGFVHEKLPGRNIEVLKAAPARLYLHGKP